MKSKGIDIFCASQAATAVCLNMDEAAASSSSSSSSSSIQLGSGRAIDRYNPIIRDPRRFSKPLQPHCSPQPPTTPKPQNHQSKTRKSFSKAKNEAKKKSSSKPNDQKRMNIAESNNNIVTRKGWSCTKPGDFISPPGSSRYLLSDPAFLDVPSEFDPVLKLVQVETTKSIAAKTDEPFAAKPPPSSRSPDQVVVLRVSLHCKGCERKMRKHISRMKGVTSFNIDFAAKKVTVVGDVTPLEVLASISKVKNAKFWTPPMLPPSASPGSLNNLEIRKYQEVVA